MWSNTGGRGSSRKCFSLMCRRAHCIGDAVSIMMRSLSGMKSAVTGCFPHYFLLEEQPELLIALFPIVRASMHFRWVPAYVVEVWSGLNKGRIKAQCSSKNKKDRTRRNYDTFKSTVQLILGDACWTKVNPFQGERKVDSRWDEVDYEIMRQVAMSRPRMRLKIRVVKWRHPTKTDSS